MEKINKKNIFLREIVMINVFVTVFLSTIISLSITKGKFYLKLESDVQSIQNQTDYVDASSTPNDRSYIIYKPAVTTNCVTPWGVEIEHGQSVLAYKQRDDVNTLCDVQRRTCEKGKLSGTFKQRSCREYITYEYVKEVPKCYNCKPDNPYIQPEEFASKYQGNFNTDGKINESQQVKIYRDSTVDSSYIGERTDIGQAAESSTNCATPWGSIVRDGFFVKAYKSRDGYINSPCLLEVRYCTNGSLGGQYTYKSCEYHDLSYEDYVQNGSRNLRQQFIHWIR